MKVFGIWGQGICLVIFQVGVFAAPDYSWMTYSWIEEGAAAKRVEASIKKYGPEKTLLHYRRAAKEGDAEAQFFIAYGHMEGELFDQDDALALGWLIKSAGQGYSYAQSMLGMAYFEGNLGLTPDVEEALNWFLKAAAQGDAIAEFVLAGFYLEETHKYSNREKGIVLLEKTARKGFADAQIKLACFYARGEGVMASPELALTWGLKAAEHENVQAQVEMARSYAGGHGVKKDQKEAVKWFSRAAKNGDGYSQEFLMYVFADGDGVEASLGDATNWGLRAAMNGRINAQIRMVHAYGQGIGVAVDHGESYAWAIIVDHNGESEWKEIVEPMFSVDDKVRGYRRARELEKEMRALRREREANAPILNP